MSKKKLTSQEMVEQATWRCFIDYNTRMYFVFDMAHNWLYATLLAHWCFPVPEGAVPIRWRFAVSSYEPKSFSVVWASKDLVDTSAEQSNIRLLCHCYKQTLSAIGEDIGVKLRR